ncbi:MAG TPA: cell division protein FtsL [Candidatus Binataceae bacterium]|jgi:cell division protein FtsL|nr:cell division protein FtsL [Candidatus Binataceae bacterium]
MKRRPSPSRPPNRLLPAILVLAIAALGFTIVMVRLEVTQEGYRLSELRVEMARLQEQNRQLKLETAQLTSHTRLRELALHYHLAPPAPGQVVMVP